MRFNTYILAIVLGVSLSPFCVNAQVRNIVFPVDGESSFRDDFLDARGGGTRQHLATDILADKHTPLVAAVDGVISYIPYPEPSYGYMITIQDEDRYQYRYIHINNDTPGTDDGNGGRQYAYVEGLKRGSKVTAGQVIAWVGDSGNAENTTPHLHFEIRDPNRVAINPYPSLINAADPENIQSTVVVSTHEDVGNVGVEEGAEFIFTIDLKEGMQGQAVFELQSRLKEGGHFTHTLTQYYGPVTKTAVEAYQRAHNLAPSGVVDYQTRSVLNDDPVSQSGRIRLQEELYEGAMGDDVVQVQLKLQELGYYGGADTGVYDDVLREAVRSFQRDNNLLTTGHVNFDTWNTLNEKYKDAPKSVPVAQLATTAYVSSISTSLSIGSRGKEVVALQDMLRELGHFSPNVISTGYFGSVTREAVISFQRAHGIDPIGIVGPQTQEALNSPNTSPKTTLETEEVAEETSTVNNSYIFTQNLKIGSRGNEVIELQCLLRDLGYFDENTLCTGYYGSETARAVSRFQASKGIEAVGFVGPQTREALKEANTFSSRPAIDATTASQNNSYTFTQDLKMLSRGDEVVALQDRLRDLGHFSPNVISTGYFGSVTRDAVISFQKANGISPVGTVGPHTRAVLNSI